jgi:hypothetical protein
MAIAGPSGTRRRDGRPGSSSPGRMNCHQMKKDVDAAKTRIETQAFNRRPAKWWAGSMRSSSSKKRPNV